MIKIHTFVHQLETMGRDSHHKILWLNHVNISFKLGIIEYFINIYQRYYGRHSIIFF